MRIGDVIVPASSSPLLAMSDDGFLRAATDAIARLRNAEDAQEAQRIYAQEVLPCEYERLRRDAHRRIACGEDQPLDLLFVTVGAQGDSPALAIVASPARFVVLLHTEDCKSFAHEAVGKLGLDASEARLTSIGDGKDALVIHRKVFAIWSEHGCTEKVAVDLTGGLKSMSAAVAAAGFAMPRARVFYVDTDQPRLHGRTFWVDDRRIELHNPFTVFGEVRRHTARQLLADGHYQAAAVAYEDLAKAVADAKPDELRGRLARGYDALDHLGFEEAHRRLSDLADDLDRLAPILKDDAVVRARAAIRANARGAERLVRAVPQKQGEVDPARDVDVLRSDECLDLASLLLAAAGRRRKGGDLDVAALLAYRVLELVPQRRLAIRGGVDPSQIDWEVLAKSAGCTLTELVKRFNDLGRGRYRLEPTALVKDVARTASFVLLRAAFPDDVGQGVDLRRFEGIGRSRNRSVLAHGTQKLDESTTDGILVQARELFAQMLDVEKVSDEKRRALEQTHRFVTVDR
jgi:CRISPR-associated protein (TIGR02710 family)